jgi:hypothetical protein
MLGITILFTKISQLYCSVFGDGKQDGRGLLIIDVISADYQDSGLLLKDESKYPWIRQD